MKRIFAFGKKKARQAPLRPGGSLASAPASLGGGGGYDVRGKDLGKLHRAAAAGDLETLQRQVAKKRDVNLPDKARRTPLHLACANGCTNIVTFLVDNGCLLNVCDSDNMSPLMKAVQCQQDFCATYLLDHEADVNLADVNGNTALHLAAFKSNVAIAQQLLEHKAVIDAKNKDGDTPLIVAVAENNETMVEFLLKNGAHIHERNNEGRTPLLTAAAHGRHNLVKVLLLHGADLSHKDDIGWSAEDYAMISGDPILNEKIAEYAHWSHAEKSSPKSQKGLPVFGKPDKAGDAGFTLGAPATNKEVVDDHSSGELISESGNTDDDSWPSSEEEELDLCPKKLHKPSLVQLMNVSQPFLKNNEKSSVIRTELIASSQQNRSVCEGEDFNESRPLSQVKSFPHPVHSSPGSCSKISQMTSSDLHFKQDNYEEERDGEKEAGNISGGLDRSVTCNNSSQSQKLLLSGMIKNAMSALGVDDEEGDKRSESPWDSESISESPRKPTFGSLPTSPTRTSARVDNVSEEPRDGKLDDSQPDPTKGNVEGHVTSSHFSKETETREKQKSDLMEELGIDDADDIEDTSDWDSPSISLKSVPCANYSHVLMLEQRASVQPLAKTDAGTKASETIPMVAEELSSVQTRIASKDEYHNKQGMKEVGSNENEDKGVVDTPNSIEKPSHKNNSDKAEVLFTCEKQKTDAVILNEESNSEHSRFDSTLWEERYEKLWVANEKKEVKTNFKSITAELKQMFGEINVKEKVGNIPVERGLQVFSGALEGINDLPSPHLSAATTDTQEKGDFGDVRSATAEKRFGTENLIVHSPNSKKHFLKSCQPGKGNVEQNWKANDEALPSHVEGTRENITEESRDNIFVQLESSVGGKPAASEKCPHSSPVRSCKNIASDSLFKSTSIEQSMTVGDRSVPLDVAKSSTQENPHHFINGALRDCTVGSCKFNETETGNKVESSGQPCRQTSKKELDEELESDVARFKSEVGMLQVAFVALEREKAQLQKEVEKEKRKQKWEELEAAGKSEDANSERFALNAAKQKMQKPNINEKQQVETADSLEEASPGKVTFSAERKILIPLLVKGKNAAVKDVRKSENKQRISKQRANRQNTEKVHQLQDYSSLSDASLEEERHPAQTVNGKNKIYGAMGMANDSDDLPQSSDTATEDNELPTSIYREAMMLTEHLSLDSKDSVSLLKIQNVFHGYENLMAHEKGRSARLLGKVKKLETEKREQERMVEEMREVKSMVDHEKVGWENDISSLKFSLKQEREKRMSAETLYEKTQEHLRRKEDQYCQEVEEKQQLELMLRSLEMELQTLKKHLKEVEEERNEKQRQLSHEQNARALQEGILNTHIWRQSGLQEAWKKPASKSSEMADNCDREKDLLHKNQTLQEELAILRLEVDHIRTWHQEEEAKYTEENEALKEKMEELKKELKLNEEALTETVLQYNGQINASKMESAVLSSRVEHIKESKERLEVELNSLRSRLSSAVQELEQCQMSKTDLERMRQRERDDWLCLLDKQKRDLCNLQEANNGMSQQLSKAEGKANHLENELHHTTHSLREKNLMLESTERELSQAQCKVRELENVLQAEKDQLNKCIVKQDSIQERSAQLQSENRLLKQQLEDYQSKGVTKEKVVTDIQDRFNDIYSKLRADAERQAQMMEDRNKEIIATCGSLRGQILKYETEKIEREGALRQLQQELADSLKKQSMSEASLEVTARCRMDLEEEKQQLQNEVDRLKCKLRESEDQYVQSARCTQDLRNALDAKEQEASLTAQKLQDLLAASSGTNNDIKQLEEHIQRLEIENARLEATTKQQSGRIEILQKNLQDTASVHGHLEEMITGLQMAKLNVEEELNHQVQKRNMLSVTAQDTHHMWEEEMKSKSKLSIRLSELDREKMELTVQLENERKKVKKLVELKRSVETRLDQEMKRNGELQKERNEMKKLLKGAKKKLKEREGRESLSQTSSPAAIKERRSEIDIEVGKLKIKVDELSQQLETESKNYTQLASTNHDLQDQLSAMKTSKVQLEEEVAKLKRHAQDNLTDQRQMEQYKRDVEERARQEMRHNLEEVNLFLQTQAASQENMEQIRAANNASLRSQLEQRIRDHELELARLKSSQQDTIFHKELTQRELERYKELYLEEQKMRKSLGSKLDRANEKLAESNVKLLHEHHRVRPPLASSFICGSLSASPGLETVHLGNLDNDLALSRTFSLGGGFLDPTGKALPATNRVEAYLAKMRVELEKNITKEISKATSDFDAGSVRVSPVGSIDGSSNVLEQDPVSKAWQEYRDVLKRNYMI